MTNGRAVPSVAQRLIDRQPQHTPSSVLKVYVLAGAASCAGGTVVNPIDVMKIRLQLDNELTRHTNSPKKYLGTFRGMRTLVLEEGYMAVWKGWTAVLIREFGFSGFRISFYEPIKYQLGGTDKAHTPIAIKILSGVISGGIGAVIFTPADVVKVRLQAQVTGAQARHLGCLAAFRDIYQSGGVKALYTASGPTALRAMAGTSAQISTYDHTKHKLLNANLMVEGIPLHIVSSVAAGFMNAIVTAPIDIVKTRIMNQPTGEGNVKYKSALDAVLKTVKSEGITSLYKGFFPIWARIVPHTMVTFAVYEQLRILAGIAPV